MLRHSVWGFSHISVTEKKIWFSKINLMLKVNLENPLQLILTSGSNKYSLFTFWVWIFFLNSFRQNHEIKFRCDFNFNFKFPNISVSSCHKEEQTGKYCDPGGFFLKCCNCIVGNVVAWFHKEGIITRYYLFYCCISFHPYGEFFWLLILFHISSKKVKRI